MDHRRFQLPTTSSGSSSRPSHRPSQPSRLYPTPLQPPPPPQPFIFQRPSFPPPPRLNHHRLASNPGSRPSLHSLQPPIPRHPPYFASIPTQSSGLRHFSHKSPSLSPTFDLLQYSMSSDEKKNTSTPPGIRAEERSPSARSSSTLPPLHLHLLPSPTRGSGVDLSPTGPASRKRDREEDVATPGSTHSRSSSSIPTIATPQTEHPEPPLKRRGSTLDSLLIADTDVKPVINSSWEDWQRRGSPSSLFPVPAEKPLEKLADMPIGPIQPIIAFPLQFPYSPSGPSPSSNNANPPQSAGSNNLNIDPALSSVRSSADQIAGGSNTASPHIPPELRFTDETLHSATSSPGAAVLEAALQHAQAAEVGAAPSNGDDSHLAPPEVEGLRKEQPFSRSPELRISHKLAERKRRKEMKDLFDELREHLPAERGSKSSKWEILSKAIDYIAQLKSQNADLSRANENLKRDLDMARDGPNQASLRQWQQYGQFPTQQGPAPVTAGSGQVGEPDSSAATPVTAVAPAVPATATVSSSASGGDGRS